MDTVLVYIIIITGLFAGLLAIRLSATIIRLWRSRVVNFFLRFLLYPTLARRVPVLNSITPIRGLLLICYISGTLFCNFWGVSDSTEASSRAGWISIATMIPIFVTGRFAVAMDLLGLSLDEIRAIHSATGLMATSQTVAHIGIELQNLKIQLADRVQYYGLLAAVGLAALLVLILLKKRVYQFFKLTHLLLALFVTFSIWCHPQDSTKAMLKRPYLIAAVGAYTVFVIVQTASIILRNLILRSRCARTHLQQHGDGFHLQMNFKTAFDIYPGQFVYLWMPGVSFTSLFRTYPFMICWQPQKYVLEKDQLSLIRQDEKDGHTSVALAPLTHGIGKKLQRVNQLDLSFLAWVDGPYGHPPDWGNHDEVIFIASGIGIAAQMLPIKHLVEGRKDRTVRTKSISVHWKVDNSLNADWVNTYFDYLLKLDAGKAALNIEIYVPQGDRTTEYSAKRITIRDNDEEKMLSLVRNELDLAKGKVLLSVCSDSTLRNAAKHLCTQRYFHHPIVKYHASDFEVERSRSWWWSFMSRKHS